MFPMMSIVDPDISYRVAREFLLDPVNLPNSVRSANDLEISWPEDF